MEPVVRAKQLSHQGSLMQRHLNEIENLEKLEAKHHESMNWSLDIQTGSITKEQRERLIAYITESLEKFKKDEIADVEKRIQILLEQWIDKHKEARR